MKTKLDKFFKNYRKEKIQLSKGDAEGSSKLFLKLESEVYKLVGGYREEIKSKTDIIQNQLNELDRLRLETYLYKCKVQELQKAKELEDFKFEGWDKYQLTKEIAKVFNSLPACFSTQQIEEVAMPLIGASSEDVDVMLWRFKNLHLVSQKADSTWRKLIDKVPEDLNEIQYIRKRISITNFYYNE